MGFRKRPFGRLKKSKREIQKEQKEQFIKEIEDFKENIYNYSDKGNPINSVDIYETGLADFFRPVSFEANKIHILRGNNGQGKSTLLKNIVKSTSFNHINSYSGKIKFGSNDYQIAQFLTNGEESNPFRFKWEEIQSNQFINEKEYDNTKSNVKNNITLYTDFTIDFFRNKVDLLSEVLQTVDNHSNGERKIAGINNLFHYLKIIQNLDIEKIKNSVNIIICMDEPESGLSVELQEEFYKRVKYYLNKITKSPKMTLTFFIVSHSFIWKKEKDIIIHNINELKKEHTKKEYTKIFI